MDDILEVWAYWLQHTIIPMFWGGVGMADDNEHNLDHPPINNRDAYVIPTGMVPYIARVPGKFVAPGGAK